MKRIIEKADIQRLSEANESVKGTNDYYKYQMMVEYKRKENGKWSRWKFIGWSFPVCSDMKVKKVGRKVYLIIENNSDGTITRYTLTESCNEILKVY